MRVVITGDCQVTPCYSEEWIRRWDAVHRTFVLSAIIEDSLAYQNGITNPFSKGLTSEEAVFIETNRYTMDVGRVAFHRARPDDEPGIFT